MRIPPPANPAKPTEPYTRDVTLAHMDDPYEGIAPEQVKHQMKLILLDMVEYLDDFIPEGDTPWPLTERRHLTMLEEKLWFLLEHQIAWWLVYNKNPRWNTIDMSMKPKPPRKPRQL